MRSLTLRGVVVLGVAFGCSVLGVQPANAAFIDEDFQSDAAGSAPAGALYVQHNLPPAARVEVTGTNLTDPFGGAGNQSMGITNQGGMVPAVSFQGTLNPAAGLNSGKLSFDIYVDGGDLANDNSVIDIRGCDGTQQGVLCNNVPQIWLEIGHAAGNASAHISQVAVLGQIDNIAGFTVDAPHLIEIEWFDANTAGYFTLSIDGNLASHQGDTTFDFFAVSAPSGIGLLQFQNTTSVSEIYIDNVVMTPEPASFVLLAGGALALIKRHR